MLLPMQPVLDGRFFITQGVDELPHDEKFRFFKPGPEIVYSAFCDDFGPMNLACLAHFILQLDQELSDFPESCIFFNTEEGNNRSLTNSIFLVGAYMIIKLNMGVEEVNDSFHFIDMDLMEPYRDATYCNVDFELSLEDCWRGLVKGKQHGWVKYAPNLEESWGLINIEEYAHYDSPLNGDMHEIVPGKFLAFMGPHDLGGLPYFDDQAGRRRFSPGHYVEIFEDFGVEHVVRLNESEYNERDFEEHGICHHALEFEDCTPPPAAVVEAFLAVADQSKGAVAVHCKAGLGRTGTLIAVYLMRSHGFTAREAMGWLRIMRPGSVIGEQQHYLCAVERAGGDFWTASALRQTSSKPDDARNVAEQVAAGMALRCAARNQEAAGQLP